MEELVIKYITWFHFFAVAFGLLMLYFFLKFMERLLNNISFSKSFQQILEKWNKRLLSGYELIVLAVLGSLFVLINPIYHGLLILFVLVFGFTHIRNYFSGRLLKMGNKIRVGSELITGGKDGIISSMDRLGLNLQTNTGVHHLQYNQLIAQGYTLRTGEDVGCYYSLLITPKGDAEYKGNHATRLLDYLITAPYLDWHHKPDIRAVEGSDALKAQILVREENHLQELIALIEEWGYHCKMN